MNEFEDVTEELGFQFIRSKKDAKKTNEIKKEIERSYLRTNQNPPYKVPDFLSESEFSCKNNSLKCSKFFSLTASLSILNLTDIGFLCDFYFISPKIDRNQKSLVIVYDIMFTVYVNHVIIRLSTLDPEL